MAASNEAEIEKVQQEIQELLGRKYQLRIEISNVDRSVETLENYLAYLSGKPVGEVSVSKSIKDHLIDILKAKQAPMHSKELLEAIRQLDPGLEHTAFQTVTGVLIRNSNKGKYFKRVAPNIYGILETDDEA
ncbi:MAG: hypothetical protein WKF92_09835 [Pyrinomonadaceae bacterium]